MEEAATKPKPHLKSTKQPLEVIQNTIIQEGRLFQHLHQRALIVELLDEDEVQMKILHQ